jgi:hypothetical protein
MMIVRKITEASLTTRYEVGHYPPGVDAKWEMYWYFINSEDAERLVSHLNGGPSEATENQISRIADILERISFANA